MQQNKPATRMNSPLFIFDLDGTLIDSRADLTAAINHMRTSFGLDELPLETVSGFIGNGARKLVERAVSDAQVDVDEAFERNKEYYLSHLTVHTTCYPGVQEGIKALAERGCKMAVLTNKPGASSRIILDHFGLSPYLVTTIGGGDISALKPDPAGAFRCIELADASKENCWMVGDHYTDLSVAKNAGIQSIFARYGFGEMRGFKPTQSIDSFSELLNFVD
jgi:phosphoglycolate phosphatase